MRSSAIPAAPATAPIGAIMVDNINPHSGRRSAPAQALDPHLGSGSIKGLIDMRDGTLSDLATGTRQFRQSDGERLQRAAQCQCRLPAADAADRPQHGPAFERCAEFHRQDHDRGHRFQRQSGVAHRCRFRRRHVVGRWRRCGQHRHTVGSFSDGAERRSAPTAAPASPMAR